jgi:tetratricopeptide (TPR) repeat protein
VLGKTTANAYKDTDKSLTEIGREREVKTIIEGALSCFGEDSICFIAKVIEVYPQERQLDVQNFKVARSQIPNLYNMVTKELTTAVDLVLTPEDEQILSKSRSVDKEAYDAYLKGLLFLEDFSAESLYKAMDFLNSAIAKDSSWAILYGSRAKVWMGLQQMGLESPSIAGPQLFENLNKALELDPDLADAHFMKAMIAYLAEWNWEKGEKEFLKAIAINPNDAYSRMYYAHLLYILKRSDEAAVQAQLAYELDPLNPIILITYSHALLCARDCETALIHAEKALEIDPESFIANNQVGGAAFRCKDYEKAFKTRKVSLQVYSHSTGQFDKDDFKEIERIFDEQGYFAAYDEIVHRYEVLYKDGLINPGVMAIIYIAGNKQEQALECLEKGYELHDPQMPYIAAGGYPFDSLYTNPRFLAILDKMKLPHPQSK